MAPPVARAEKKRSRRRVGRKTGGAATPERRLLTVMFCDLAESTRLSGEMEMEDWSRILLAYRDSCVAAVDRHQGTVAQFLGDGLLIFFGYPMAHEDDAPRAIRAALGVQQRIAHLNQKLAGEGTASLAVRIGIHTGMVVVGDLGTEHHVEMQGVIGETPNIAARLQTLAGPGEIIVSQDTHRLAEGHFRFHTREPQTVRGVGRMLHTSIVLGEVPAQQRLGVRRYETPLIAHQKELNALLEAWQEVERCSGVRGRVVWIEGEPGIGKSRLVQELRAWVGEQQPAAMQCAADSIASAFHPVVEWLGTLVPVDEAAGPERARELAGETLVAHGLSDPELIAAATIMLGLADAHEQAEAAKNPRRQRRRLIDAVLRLVSARARQGPLLLVLEDAHWADDSTLTLLSACVELVRRAPILIVITSRGAVLGERTDMLRLRLGRLSDEEARQLVRSVTGDAITPALMADIVDRTDGVPLFIEEVAWTVARGDQTGVDKRHGADDIPMTLGHSLAARLDQLGGARPVVQAAAMLGRVFRVDLLAATFADTPGSARLSLPIALEQLTAARFIEAVPGSPNSFKFRHALIQEAAYSSMLRERRQTQHRLIADLLRTRFKDTPEARPEVVAWHCSVGGQARQAIEYFAQAAQQAARMAAAVEAVQHYQSALSVLEQYPALDNAAEKEVDLQINLASHLVVTRGNAAPEVGHALHRARHLADGLGNSHLRFRALRHLQTFQMVRGNLREAYDVSSELREEALRHGDTDVLLQVHRPHGLCLLYLGRFDEARVELLRALYLYDGQRHAAHRFEFGSDPAVLARAHLGWVEWFLGRPEAAMRYSAEAVSSARALGHAHSLCFALAFAGCLAQFSGDAEQTRVVAQEMGQLAQENIYLYWAAWSEILVGWAMVKSGERERGERLLHDGFADYTATGAGLLRPYCLYLLADCMTENGVRQAIALLNKSLEEAEACSILYWQTETTHLRDRLLHSLPIEFCKQMREDI